MVAGPTPGWRVWAEADGEGWTRHIVARTSKIGAPVIVLGIILILLTAVLDVPPILYTIGIILVVVGVILWILGSMGRAVGGRRHYW